MSCDAAIVDLSDLFASASEAVGSEPEAVETVESAEVLETSETETVDADQPTTDGEPEISQEEAVAEPQPTDGLQPGEIALVSVEGEPDEDDASPITDLDRLIAQIKQAEYSVRDQENTVRSLNDDLKDAKETLDERMAVLLGLVSQLPGRSDCKPISATDKPADPASEAKPTATDLMAVAADGAPAITAGQSPDDNAWRSISIDVLFDPPIKRLGEKKQESLRCAVPTLGDLEDRRRDKGQQWFQGIDGIGEEMGGELESAVVNYLAAWHARKSDATPVDAEPVTNDPDAVNEDGIPADGENGEEDGGNESASDEPAILAEDAEAIFARAEELNDGSENSLDSHHADGDVFWQSGAEAFGRGISLEECPYIPGPEQNDWIRGWLNAGEGKW